MGAISGRLGRFRSALAAAWPSRAPFHEHRPRSLQVPSLKGPKSDPSLPKSSGLAETKLISGWFRPTLARHCPTLAPLRQHLGAIYIATFHRGKIDGRATLCNNLCGLHGRRKQDHPGTMINELREQSFRHNLGVNSVGHPEELDREVTQEGTEVWSDGGSEYRCDVGAPSSESGERLCRWRRALRMLARALGGGGRRSPAYRLRRGRAGGNNSVDDRAMRCAHIVSWARPASVLDKSAISSGVRMWATLL